MLLYSSEAWPTVINVYFSVFLYRSMSCLNLVIMFFHSYMFDEPSSYLDVKQRLKCALTVRSLLNDDR